MKTVIFIYFVLEKMLTLAVCTSEQFRFTHSPLAREVCSYTQPFLSQNTQWVTATMSRPTIGSRGFTPLQFNVRRHTHTLCVRHIWLERTFPSSFPSTRCGSINRSMHPSLYILWLFTYGESPGSSEASWASACGHSGLLPFIPWILSSSLVDTSMCLLNYISSH